MGITDFFRSVVQQLPPPYAPSLRLEKMAEELRLAPSQIVKLDSGENIFAPPLPFDWATLGTSVALYPDSTSTELRRALAKDLGVPVEMIAVGNGSDELIDLLCRLFLEKDKTLLDFPPTFPMFRFFGMIAGATILTVSRKANFSIDLQKSLAAMNKADLTFLANPNNPTGTLVDQNTIEQLLKTGRPLVVDEAYCEFAGQTVLPLVNRFPNLIILRTFSKWAGLAGVRIGYIIADPKVIEKILAIKPPYSVSGVAQELALAALKNKKALLKSVEQSIAGRDWFLSVANQLPNCSVVPSRASCITIVPQEISSAIVTEKLRKKGILVKRMSMPGLPDMLRISAAPQPIMERVFKELQQILSN